MLQSILDKNLVTVEPDTSVAKAAQIMESHGVGSVLVVGGDERLIGILTDRDIVVRCVARNLDVDDTTVENIATDAPETVKLTDGVYDCVHKMHQAGVRRIPVVNDNGKPVGILSFGDLVGFLSEELYEITSSTCPPAESPELKAA